MSRNSSLSSGLPGVIDALLLAPGFKSNSNEVS
jgi:hypothetical protein